MPYRERHAGPADKDVTSQLWGTDELPVLDMDRNAITFYDSIE